MLASPPARSAREVCSAWAEPARIAVWIERRKRHRMRADQPWVFEVAGNPQSSFGYENILMSPQEQQELQAALADLPKAQIALEIRSGCFTMQQLQARMQAMTLDSKSLAAEGIDLMGYGPRVDEKVIRLEVRSNRLDAAARLEAGHEGMVKAIVYPIPE
jgi:hypothetical protein